MRRELDPGEVAQRLEALRAMDFARTVADRLQELRALDQLTRYLHDRATPTLRHAAARRPQSR